MKKLSTLILALSCSFMAVASTISSNVADGAHTDVALADYQSFNPLGDSKGGIRVTFNYDETDNPATLKVIPQTNDFGEDGFYMRLKNNKEAVKPILFFINSTENHRVKLKISSPLYTYNSAGQYQGEILTREFGSYIMLPASFDGWIHFPFSSFESLSAGEWAGNGTALTMNWRSVYGLYLACSTKYDADSDFEIGDILTETSTILDTSTLSDMDFETTFSKDFMGEFVNTTRLSNPKDITIEGNFDGAATLTYTHTDVDDYSTVRFQGSTQDFSGEGLFMRIRNNVTLDTWVTFFINGLNGHRVGPKAGEAFYTYDAVGENKTVQHYRDFGHYFLLPSSFDGYVYLPYATLESLPVSEWAGNDGTTMDYSQVFACYFTMSTYYDSFANYTIGDVFTSNSVLFDGSEVTQDEFGNFFINDNQNNPTIIHQEDGFKSSVPEFDYSTVNYQGEVDKGAKLEFVAHSDDVLSVIKVVPTIKDYSDAIAFTFRIKNLSGDFPFLFSVVDGDNASQTLGGKNVGPVYFVKSDGSISINQWGGNPISTKIPYPFDGWCVIPTKSLAGTPVNLSNISHFEIKVAVKYDYNFINIFGDAGFIKEDASLTTTLDVSGLSQQEFEQSFVKTQNEDYARISRYQEPRKSEWIGDTKILDSLNYESDEELKKNITWDPGDNKCSYEKYEDGMKVDIGPYETGHAYGDYMALGMFDKGLTTDRRVWNVDKDGNSKNALGITMYLKNLSSREIGINLQFDENGETPERWIVKGYPAMYYAYDVVKDADYIFYAKSDQIQIPVGFEGYVRIPFTSYRVPDWCHGEGFKGTDDVLDISKISGNFFLTSDCTRYEDLSFFIKNVGIYFNETQAGSLFNSNNTIKANMGLGE